jgi:hypothetical protein
VLLLELDLTVDIIDLVHDAVKRGVDPLGHDTVRHRRKIDAD